MRAGHGQGPLARRALDWFLRDRRTGRIVVAQAPNLPILLFLASLVARLLVEAGTGADVVLRWAGWLALGWWSIDELARGVNPFRRLLGLGGCVVVAVGVIGSLRA